MMKPPRGGAGDHLTGVALDHWAAAADLFDQELSVKEVEFAQLDRVFIHTVEQPLRTAAKYREFGGSFIYPMGDDMLTIGMVVGLNLPRTSSCRH